MMAVKALQMVHLLLCIAKNFTFGTAEYFYIVL